MPQSPSTEPMPAAVPIHPAGAPNPNGRGRLATALAVARVKFDTAVREVGKFGVVGLFAFVIDFGLFNILLYAGGPVEGKPLTAKAISVVVATIFAYFGNRFWTFRHRGRTGYAREYVLFFVLNGIGMFIALSCLWFTHYALGLTGPLANNISANVIGLGLGTMFRFWSYRKWVFPDASTEEALKFAEV